MKDKAHKKGDTDSEDDLTKSPKKNGDDFEPKKPHPFDDVFGDKIAPLIQDKQKEKFGRYIPEPPKINLLSGATATIEPKDDIETQTSLATMNH